MQRYFAKQREENQFLLETDDYHHIKNVMRFKDGEKIQVVFEAIPYLCVLHYNQDQIQISFLEELEKTEDSALEVILLLPLLKEQKMDFVLQKATELGVHKIVPVMTERSIVKLKEEKVDKKIERWTRICKEASEQSYRTDIPEITEIMTYQTMPKWDGLKLVCSTTEKVKTIKSSLQNESKCARIVIAVGPEGGLSEKEESYLTGIGFEAVTLGNRIMRVETVPIFILSILNYERMR